MKTAIIYHRVDWDGYTSAAVALRAFPDAELIGWSYGDNEPCVSEFDRVIVVDLSLSESWMLSNASKLIWIDHHASKIDALQNNPVLASIPGIRQDGLGACWLTWLYLHNPDEAVCPAHVKYVAAADVMDYENTLVHLKKALTYMLYLDTFGPGFIKPVGDVSKYHVAQALRLFDDREMSKGFSIGYDRECHRASHERELFENAHDCVVDGFKVCVLPIDGRPNACILNHLIGQTHDAFVCIGDIVPSEGKYKISVRVSKDSAFDANAFCSQYKNRNNEPGGGHLHAAGCVMSSDEILEKFGVLVD